MPTKLAMPNDYVTPDEFIELLRHHFKQVPTEKLFSPVVQFTSCDSSNNETVLFSKTHGKGVGSVKLDPFPKPHNYEGDLCLKTIVREKSKVN